MTRKEAAHHQTQLQDANDIGLNFKYQDDSLWWFQNLRRRLRRW